ncbi:hypothetical protein RJT34_19630 [Clitoria ternatea]|uniref:Purple acid phosphatase n=1 Tax=Clitoria ternatea TaxID=43366 RepID=A0AAN9IRM7_CLITE
MGGLRMRVFLLFLIIGIFDFHVVCGYTRPPPRRTLFIPLADPDSDSPQQVHISQVGRDRMRISWITDGPTSARVDYGPSPAANAVSATGKTSSYRYLTYESGEIHDVVIGPLNPKTVYYYRLGGSPSSQTYSFQTPPSQFPIKFAVVGDLGQTEWTKSTLEHIGNSTYDMLLLPGDLSYADVIQDLWDSYGRLVEPLARQRPWMVTQGNHEVEKIPVLHSEPFTAYNARWRMPYEESASDSNLYYSFDVAGVHVIMLASYTDFDPDSSQYKWLQGDLKNINRVNTPWVFALIHAPWYNSNTAHQGEPESVSMKASMEDLLYQSRVDLVFAGHVHAYERFYINPKPEISMFREASFGHGILDVVNASHALWSWHRNDNDEPVVSDSVWFTSLSSNPSCKV